MRCLGGARKRWTGVVSRPYGASTATLVQGVELFRSTKVVPRVFAVVAFFSTLRVSQCTYLRE